jgi:hypothetical protein
MDTKRERQAALLGGPRLLLGYTIHYQRVTYTTSSAAMILPAYRTLETRSKESDCAFIIIEGWHIILRYSSKRIMQVVILSAVLVPPN